MSDIRLIRLDAGDLAEFKREMQQAFQLGYEAEFGPCPEPVLPETDIDRSLAAPGAFAYAAMQNGVRLGGAVVKIDRAGRHHHLDLLYVRTGVQSQGVGQAIWSGIERLYPDALSWETCTPYFEKRNIHFYVNCCGFHIVEFFHPRHPFPPPDDEYSGGMADEASQFFFRFVKEMPPRTRPE